MSVIRELQTAFRADAQTAGISPKALAPLIGAAITAGLSLVGFHPSQGGWVVGTISSLIAAWMLGPGNVQTKVDHSAPAVELMGSDARMDHSVFDEVVKVGGDLLETGGGLGHTVGGVGQTVKGLGDTVEDTVKLPGGFLRRTFGRRH